MQENEQKQITADTARLEVSLRLIRSGEAAAALAPLRESLAADPTDVRARYLLGAACLRSGHPACALEEFEILLDQMPEHNGAAHGRGLALFALADREGALHVFRLLTQRDALAPKAWGSIADITPCEDERRHAIDTAADLHAAISEHGENPDRRAAASALIAARRPAEAAALLERSHGPVSGAPMPDRLLARALYHQGKFEDAYTEACRLLAHAKISRENVSHRPAFNPGAASEVLAEILDLLSASGASAFLVAGTLLGFFRNGAPLAHDRDIDIGVMRDRGGGPDIAALLRAHDRILLPRIARPGDRYFGVQYKGVAVDIFLFDPHEGSLTCGFSDMPGDIQWRFRSFGIRAAEFNGRPWPIPDQPEDYLAQTYGPHWRVPDRAFASAVSSPALFRTDIHARAYYAALRARGACIAGDLEKAKGLISQSPLPIPPLAADAAAD